MVGKEESNKPDTGEKEKPLDSVSIAGLDKAEVLAALYNTARPQGMGFMHYNPTPMTVELARQILAESKRHNPEKARFDYARGRVMKIDIPFEGDEIYPGGFDMDNGRDVCAAVIADLRKNHDVNSPFIQKIHKGGKLDAAELAEEQMEEEIPAGPQEEKVGGSRLVTFRLGLGDMANHLKPKIKEALKE